MSLQAWQSRTSKPWHFAVTTVLLAIAFAGYLLASSLKCRCHFSSWHQAHAIAGLAFVVFALARMLLAWHKHDNRFRWELYVALTLLSPLWIAAIFETVLAIRELWFG